MLHTRDGGGHRQPACFEVLARKEIVVKPVLNHFRTCIILHRLPNELTVLWSGNRVKECRFNGNRLREYALVRARILARPASRMFDIDSFKAVRNGTSIARLSAGW